MIENHKDEERTNLFRRVKIFLCRDSWISIAGHVYLAGQDASRRRAEVFAAEPNCAICGKRLRPGQGDLDHIKGGRPLVRCWCYGQVLSDGTICTNVRRTHGMFAYEPCHREKHGRELRWKSRSSGE